MNGLKIWLAAACAAVFMLAGNVCGAAAQGRAEYSPADSARVELAICNLKSAAAAGATMPEMLISCAQYFLGTPYVAGTLEKMPERLIINARETDCILFVEMCLAACLTARDGGGFAQYCDNVRKLRYRDGVVDGYASRLHYTSEWIRQAQGRGVLHEVTSEIGGQPYPQKFFFMSTHPASYRQLASGDAVALNDLERIKAAEASLSKEQYFLLGKSDAASHLSEIQDGDIVCFNTSVAGLDIAHVALAYRQNGKMTFIHASSTAHKVIVNPVPLLDYIASRKTVNGLRILRTE